MKHRRYQNIVKNINGFCEAIKKRGKKGYKSRISTFVSDKMTPSLKVNVIL